MKTLVERKTPEKIAEELDEEISEVGADFADKVVAKLKKYGYDPSDSEARKLVVSTFFDLRR
jgi:lipoate-protein ligase A